MKHSKKKLIRFLVERGKHTAFIGTDSVSLQHLEMLGTRILPPKKKEFKTLKTNQL